MLERRERLKGSNRPGTTTPELGRRFRRRLSKKTVPTKAADWEIVPTTVPPWVLDQDDGSEEGYELGRRLRV